MTEPANTNEGRGPHILDSRDPLWPHQQSFLEVAFRSREEDPTKLYELAVQDYEEVFKQPPPENLRVLFEKWSEIHAEINVEINADPDMNPPG